MGALFLEQQIRKCVHELHEIEGYSYEVLPKIKYAKVPESEKKIVKDLYKKD